jgi:hypothetical protein
MEHAGTSPPGRGGGDTGPQADERRNRGANGCRPHPTLRRTLGPPPKAEGSRQRGAVGSSGAGAAAISWCAPWVIASPSVWKRKTGSRTDFAINTLAPYVLTALINKPKISARVRTTGLAQASKMFSEQNGTGTTPPPMPRPSTMCCWRLQWRDCFRTCSPRPSNLGGARPKWAAPAPDDSSAAMPATSAPAISALFRHRQTARCQ